MTDAGRVPSAADDPEVQAFLKLQNLTGPAVFLNYADHGYGPNWCHVSAKHKAITDGGRRVHGWALWAFKSVIVGDHHSVWQTPDNALVDVTPPKYGASRILFVRDDAAILETDGENVYLLTNRSSVHGAEFLWNGSPSDYSHLPCPLTKPDLLEYSEQFDFPPSSIATDAAFG